MDKLTPMTSMYFEQLLSIARRKSVIDTTSDWFNGSQTYLNEMRTELDEVLEEIPLNRRCYLEQELGDLLWDYLNLLLALESETEIQLESVLERACIKFQQRVSGLENGFLWSDIKARQKISLAEQQQKWELQSCVLPSSNLSK
ncbi:MazG nucleotide pyrophosphohydrolase domain-containing protein [Vibrio diazotrophicus]|uniref:MazG nucleotide pyrophosphohydrolase domain-containing protein n=1 Tax=Vibrio diazotrophicus TaxID=685 RepID=UPI000C9E790D|nr:MazG nucleotide pyrophosphohydrolase domain-containing protein [Vibrio diazotrophicus]PNH89418.1 nucleotide pyrophosphohydrolase [Vibrio diazotrophicus]